MSYNSDIEQPKTSERLGIQSSACSESTCGFKKTPWGELYRWLIDVRAKFRAWCGFCPACNSDAPEIDRCWLCRGYRWDRDGVPNKQTKRLWMHRWENGPGTSPNDIIPNT